MKTITVTEANQAFSRLLREMEKDGEGYVILRRGRPIARLLPERGDKMSDPEWRAAYERMMAHLRKGAHLVGLRVNRDDLYER
jgi:prevent-host-death family protein